MLSILNGSDITELCRYKCCVCTWNAVLKHCLYISGMSQVGRHSYFDACKFDVHCIFVQKLYNLHQLYGAVQYLGEECSEMS